MFRAIKQYDGGDYPECINLTEHDVISDVTRLDTHWYRGTSGRTGKTGTFPVSCVEPMPDDKMAFTDTPVEKTTAKQSSSLGAGMNHKKSDTSVTSVRFQIETCLKKNKAPAGKNKQSFKIPTNNERTQIEPKLARGALAARTNKRLHTDRDEHKILKAMFGALFSVLMGGIIFVLLKYSFDYSFMEASIIASGCTVVLVVCLAVSTFCRCIVALVLPNLCTGKGRAVILSIIFGIIQSNSLANITHNAKNTGNSLACITELAITQSREIQQHLAAPIKDIVEFAERQQQALNAYSDEMEGVMNALDTVLTAFKGGVRTIEDTIDDIVQKCDAPLEDIKSVCTSVCGLVLHCNECDKLTGQCRHIRNAFEATGVMGVAQQVIETIHQAKEFFRADLEINSTIATSAESNTSPEIIRQDINRDIEAKARTFQDIVYWLKKVLSLSLALLFFQSSGYLRSYLAKDDFDNIYITKAFRKLDKESADQVLPLKKKEKRTYVIATSMKLGTRELSYCKLGLAVVFLHFVLCCLIVTFDFALYYILNQVNKYSDITLTTGAHSEVNMNVEGSGPVADFYRMMLGGLHINKGFNMDLNIETCLPKPSRPSVSVLPVFIALYLSALASVILRGYGMRLRCKIAAYFYPEQERERLDYLQKKIRNKRVGLLKLLRQQIKCTHKESKVDEKLQVSTWLKFRFPCIARCIPARTRLECTSCKQKESSTPLLKMTPCGGETGGVKCDAIFCEECLTALRNVCPICTEDEVM